MILAYKRDGAYLTPGVLNSQNKLDGEGPFRLVPPQKNPGPPDQSSTSGNQNVIWPHNYDWDHNAGSSSRTVTIIKVEPLPPGTTDIDVLEAGWQYVDQEKIIIYGALEIEDEDQGGNSGSQGNIHIPNFSPYINSLFTMYPMSGYLGGFGSPYLSQSLGGLSPFGTFGNYFGTGTFSGGYPGTLPYYSGLSQYSGPYQPFSLYGSQPFSYYSPFGSYGYSGSSPWAFQYGQPFTGGYTGSALFGVYSGNTYPWGLFNTQSPWTSDLWSLNIYNPFVFNPL